MRESELKKKKKKKEREEMRVTSERERGVDKANNEEE